MAINSHRPIDDDLKCKFYSEQTNPSLDLRAEMGYIYNGLGLTVQSLDNNEDVSNFYLCNTIY